MASVGTVGDAFDNALAETTIALYKTEAVRDDSPFRRGPLHRLTNVELLTAESVHWYNTDRLMHRLGRIPPHDYEAIHYASNASPLRDCAPITGVHQTRGDSRREVVALIVARGSGAIGVQLIVSPVWFV